MAHYAVLCPSVAGHMLPLGALGAELARRGHRVTLVGRHTAERFADQLNLPLYKLDTDAVPYPSNWPLWATFSVFGAGWRIALRDAFRWRAEFVLQLLPQALEELAVDGIVIDQTLTAGSTVAERMGVPFVTVCAAVPLNEEANVPPQFTPWGFEDNRRARFRNRLGYASWHWFVRPMLRSVNRYRRRWNLQPYSREDQSYSSLAQLCQLCPEIDFPHQELPDVFHYVGPLGGRRQESVSDFPWDQLDGRPLIFASLGTEPYASNLKVFQRILRACDGLDAQLVLTLGKWRDQASLRDQLGAAPKNAIIVDFAPQLALLDKAAVMITHAGINSVMEALARAVPLVALPRGEDQPGMASRIDYSGGGLRGSFRHGTAEELRGMIERVLREDSFRQRARQLQTAIANAGGSARAADITEHVLTTGRPALRSEFPFTAQHSET